MTYDVLAHTKKEKPSLFRDISSRSIKICVLWTAIVLVSGCASTPTTVVPTLKDGKAFWEARALERANTRWEHIVAKDFDKAFNMYTTTSRKAFSPELLRRTIAHTKMIDGKVDRVVCGDESCEVWVNTTLIISIPRVGNKQQIVPFREQWVVEDNEIRLLRDS